MSNRKIEPMRVAVFGSYYQGKAVIEKILDVQSQYPHALRLVGVATDDPTHPRVSPQKRIWRFANQEEYGMIPALAQKNNVPVWNGSIKNDNFFQKFAEEWRPDICYMATFGQRIPLPVFDRPSLGFYNFHPAVDRAWPSYTGGDPFGGMLAAKEPYCAIAMHQIDEEFDRGALVAFSEPVPFDAGSTILSMYKKTSLATADLVHWHLGTLKVVPAFQDYHPALAPLSEVAVA